MGLNKPNIEHPKVFISYAWTSEIYVNKVAAFASSLMRVGIDVLFDKFEMKPGNELNDFMEKSVKDPTVTNILIRLIYFIAMNKRIWIMQLDIGTIRNIIQE